MPINELEQHPCLNYLEQENITPLNDYQGLIIGNFPSYGCTDSLNVNLEIVNERINVPTFRMKFFYSNSPTSFKFWEYITRGYDLTNPVQNILGNTAEEQKNEAICNKLRTISFLQDQRLLITDTIWRTNRDDNNIFFVAQGAPNNVIKSWGLNNSIIEMLNRHKTISTLYFTSNGEDVGKPFWYFNLIFNNSIIILKRYVVGDILWAMEIKLMSRYFRVFFLPTTRGVDNEHSMYQNYIHDHPNEVVDLEEFRIEAYRQAFVEQNLHYNGGNPI